MAKMTLNEFADALSAAFGSDLTAMALYGSAAGKQDASQPGASHLLVLLRALRPEALRAAASAVGRWQRDGERAPMILTEAEWRSSIDVFAMEHADIAARHEVVRGTLPVMDAVSTDDLRRQLEYEAMGAMIHLRRGIVACAGNATHELELLRASKSTVMTLFRTLLRVHGTSVSDDATAVVDAVAARVGFDPAPFQAVLAHVNAARSIAEKDVDATLTGYHDGLKRFVAHVDAMFHPDAPAVD